MQSLLIPVMDAGSGHRRPAEAVAEAVERRYPGRFRIEVVDPGAEMGLFADRFLKWTWDFALGHPGCAHVGFGLVQAPWSRWYLPICFRELQMRGMEFIRERRPDVIFSTHFYWLTIGALARQRYGLGCPVLGYVIDPHRLWVEPRADGIAYDPHVVPAGLLRGVPPEHICQKPFPVAARFATGAMDNAALIRRYGIDPSLRTVLVSQGGQGIGKICDFVPGIHRRGIPLNLLVTCGRNAALKNRLTALSAGRTSQTNLIPLGYVDDMAELMAAADLVVCKGGPSTTFEAISLNKPILYTHWATYTEKPLVDGMLAKGCAWYAPTAQAICTRLEQVVEDPEGLGDIRKAQTKLGFRSGAGDIAEWIVGHAER
jgi:UDP-N-acetylglucosamine:LPS N-acetylglucosamine transferase